MLLAQSLPIVDFTHSALALKTGVAISMAFMFAAICAFLPPAEMAAELLALCTPESRAAAAEAPRASAYPATAATARLKPKWIPAARRRTFQLIMPV